MSEERFIEILEKEEIPCRYDMKMSEMKSLFDIALKGDQMKAISLAFSFGFKKRK